ncbi:hypothetical protein Ddye_005563 [Dipteronia dyeriana]|uniref:RNase H type-1 domain-containing protein n=1 Tax=Dipteronia dyeriana TaxID=168575 RepID=A0AAD9XGP5_9ROSI|nr:hypothetical protein Ddye_005563 [Dipteronia dyeriana]
MNFGHWLDYVWRWKINLRRPPFDCEKEQWNSFIFFLCGISIRRSIKDSIARKFYSNGFFTVGSFGKDAWVGSSYQAARMDLSRIGVSAGLASIQRRNVRELGECFYSLWFGRRENPGTSLKFNMDGSKLGKVGPAGIWGVLGDYKGNVLRRFFLFIGIHESITIFSEGMRSLCSKPSLLSRNIEVVRYSKVVVSFVNNGGFSNFNHVHTIYDICSNVAILGSTTVSFSSRASNHIVDCLANMGSSMVGDFVGWGDVLS